MSLLNREIALVLVAVVLLCILALVNFNGESSMSSTANLERQIADLADSLQALKETMRDTTHPKQQAALRAATSKLNSLVRPPAAPLGGTDWETHLPSSQQAKDWCPPSLASFVGNLYESAATSRATTCATVQRVGSSGDGGKLLCTDDIRSNDCIVYSLGSRLDFAFEVDIVKSFGCEVHTFDCTVGEPEASKVPAGVAFHPWCVGGKDEIKRMSSDLGHMGEMGQYYKLTTIREKLGHSSIDLLKMDIERHEFSVIATLKAENAPHQISFETHIHNAYGMWGRPVSQGEWEGMWATLDGLGYKVFEYEPNPLCLCCCEFSVHRV